MGKIVDMNDSVRKETGIKMYLKKFIQFSGYGNPELIRQIMTVGRWI